MSKKSGKDVLLENRKAHFLYFLTDFMVAGIVLTGTEIKSLRQGNASLSDSYITLRNGEAWINNMHISNYKDGTLWNVDPLRTRKLLLTRQELRKLERELTGTGMTIVPTKVFLHHGYAKMEIALAKGKKAHDKRDAIKERDERREVGKALRDHGKGGEGSW
ncbi:MAG: SsrA-binding protein SmpB [Bacilli bacterium]|nr:SsrA-binding protein SmpB [Bacilli bacterium]MBO6286768.1 SsrA-binding protein SmpB [Bacilli bacterium]